MPILENLWIIPLLPLLGSAINGLLGSKWPNKIVNAVAVGSTGLAFALRARSGPRIFAIAAGSDSLCKAVLHLDFSRNVPRRIRSASRSTDRRDAAGRDRSRLAHPHLFDRVHGARRRLLPLLLVPESVHVFHAHPDSRRELRACCSSDGKAWASAATCWSGSTSCEKSAADAGKKAFIVNRIGDFGFMLGMFLLFKTFGTLDFVPLFAKAVPMPAESIGPVRHADDCMLAAVRRRNR